MAGNDGTLLIEGARIVRRNFSGEESKFNAAGKKNFLLVLDEETAEQVDADGWPVKRFRPREEDENPQGDPFIQVKVEYKNKPPMIYMLTSRGRTLLSEDLVAMLDHVDIREVDLIVAPYNWSMPNGTSGISVYLRKMYVRIEEDELDRKYADVPDLDSALEYGEA